MFFNFANRLIFRTQDVVVVWELEVALSAILREASEAGTVLRPADLGSQTIDLLKGRDLPSTLLQKILNEVDFMVTRNAVTLADLLKPLESPGERKGFEADLVPERARILETIKTDSTFAEYLKLSSRK
jgi:hypothetical protein